MKTLALDGGHSKANFAFGWLRSGSLSEVPRLRP